MVVLLILLGAGSIGFILISITEGSIFAAIGLQQVAKLRPKKPLQLTAVTNTKTAPVRDIPRITAAPIELSHEVEQEQSEPLTATSRPKRQPVIFDYTNSENKVSRFELDVSTDIHQELYTVANRVLAGANFSKRGMRGTLSEAQFNTLRSEFLRVQFITQQKGKNGRIYRSWRSISKVCCFL